MQGALKRLKSTILYSDWLYTVNIQVPLLLKVKNQVGVQKNFWYLQLGVPNEFIPSLIAIFKPFL